ncbi:hypothetical protein Glove_138g16 [Diversispora epigaea]|uniref:HMG box domain-containing protein n=1 Tax=Diversispora epigaea TaxID=1348612 RepID=A0A397J0N1_9GLOM|nr:hypothetical protein Glove_138g16 [Diversispora epigaea]
MFNSHREFNVSLPSNMENDLNNIIKVPPPSKINAQKIVAEIKDNIHRRSPNGFIIYRQACCKQLKKRGIKTHGNISKIIGGSWKNLPEPVKEEYKDKADEVNRLLIIKRKQNFSESHRSLYCPGSSAIHNFKYRSPYEPSLESIQSLRCLGLNLDEDVEDSYLKHLELVLPRHEFDEYVSNLNFEKYINRNEVQD